jgi:hypothetical protein
MVWYRIVDMFSGEPKFHGPTRLPDYFPVNPVGCENHAAKLFACLAKDATEKERDMERAGLHQSYFDDVKVEPESEKYAALAAAGDNPDLPKPGDNPLDVCRTQIAYYKRCCDRELRKKKNWLLTEPHRVQEEYRYNKEEASMPVAAAPQVRK